MARKFAWRCHWLQPAAYPLPPLSLSMIPRIIVTSGEPAGIGPDPSRHVKVRIAGDDLVIILAVFEAGGQEDFRAAKLHRTFDIEVQRGLVEF